MRPRPWRSASSTASCRTAGSRRRRWRWPRRLARGPRVALRYMKRNMNAAETGSLKDCLDLEAWHHTRTGFTEDHREAAKAFVDKREPVFRGR